MVWAGLQYDRFRREIARGESAGLAFQERARVPEKIACIEPMLGAGVRAEAAGLAALSSAVEEIS